MRKLSDSPSPITGGPLEICVEESSATFRGEVIPFEKTYFHCVESGSEYATEEMEAQNLNNLYNAYRRMHNIPLPEELTEMRKSYGIPARAFSLILGLGENQYRLYESGTVPSLSVGKLLALAKNPRNMKEMLLSARASLSDKEYSKYSKAIYKAEDKTGAPQVCPATIV